MSYTSYFYLLFFLGVLVALYYLIPLKKRWLVLLGGSYFFYWMASGKMIVFLLITTVSVYLGALAMEREQQAFDSVRKSLEKEERKTRKAVMMRRKRHIVFAMVLINVGLLAFLKYYHFFSANINALGSHLEPGFQLPALKLLMPLGISFYTLSAVGYVIDVYRGQTAADHHFGRLALFLSLFTNITEGPISRYDQLAGQAFEGHRADYRQFTFGAQLILWGLFQKMVLADRAALLVSTVFGSPSDYSGGIVILAMFVYTLQIYADFAGCMDIVRGSGALFGIEIARNFNQPFFSKSIGEFWRRWHMTLGAWFKDYIFYPFSISKHMLHFGKFAKKRFGKTTGRVLPICLANILIFFIVGVWHGASWKYILYGLYNGIIIALSNLLKPVYASMAKKCHINTSSRYWKVVSIIRTFIIVNIGWLFDACLTAELAFKAFTGIFRGFTFSVLANGSLLRLGLNMRDYKILIVGTVILFITSVMKEKGINLREFVAQRPLVVRWALYIILIFATAPFGYVGSTTEFVYAQF